MARTLLDVVLTFDLSNLLYRNARIDFTIVVVKLLGGWTRWLNVPIANVTLGHASAQTMAKRLRGWPYEHCSAQFMLRLTEKI